MKRTLTIERNQGGVWVSVVFMMDRVVRFEEPIKLEVLRGCTEVDKDALNGKADFCMLNLTSGAVTNVVDAKKVRGELARVKRCLEDLESEVVVLDNSIEEALFGD